MIREVTTAVLPVAGLGTRFLPATKALPKEMLTVVDKPVIQYAMEEARAAGIEQFIFVTGRQKTSLEDHFDVSFELRETLRARGKTGALEEIERWLPKPGRVASVRQQDPLGLGHAVLCARHLIGDNAFAVMLPDDMVLSKVSCMAQMIEAYREVGGNLFAVSEVPHEHTQRYGILDVSADDGRLVKVKGLVEKPVPAEAPSNLSIIGRYILQPEVFVHLERTERGAGNEIQLTDALVSLLREQLFHGLRFEGKRYDCGDKLGFLEANIAFGCARDDVAPALKQLLRQFV
jgi:UTP--glucose-1-phosphate uridylyltransferase